jgi:hypothetical protein
MCRRRQIEESRDQKVAKTEWRHAPAPTPTDHRAHGLIYTHITRERNGSEQFHYYNDI